MLTYESIYPFDGVEVGKDMYTDWMLDIGYKCAKELQMKTLEFVPVMGLYFFFFC